MDAETKADLRVKVRRRVSEYIQKAGLPLNRTGSGETEDVTFSIEAGLLGDGFEKQLTAYLHSHTDTKVVIVDTLLR